MASPATTLRPEPRPRGRGAAAPLQVLRGSAGAADLDALAVAWQRALTAAERSLAASDRAFPPAELGARRQALARERRVTAEELGRVARVTGKPLPWLAPASVTPPLLGLPRDVEGCVFDLEGVLTDGARLHAWAWATVFDDLLERLGEKIGVRLEPFRRAEYREYLEGRPRLEGVRAFLGSRGISLPEGSPDDPVDADTAYGLARRKGDVLARGLHPRGVTALAGARRYLQAAGQAGLARAAVSASSSTRPMLELAGLDTLIDAQVDAAVMAAEHLRARPAPDLLLAACRRLGVVPEKTVTLTHTRAGIDAGCAAGLVVLGVAGGDEADLLAGPGTRIVPSLAVLLEPRFADP